MDIIKQARRQIEQKINVTLPAVLLNKIIQTVTATGLKGQLHFGSRENRAVPVMTILQAGTAIAGTLIKGINALVDAKREKSFNNALKMFVANVELTHQRLRTLENRTSMMAKAIMPVLDVLKGRIADTNQRLTSQSRMMQMAHHRYNLLIRLTHEMLTIHYFALLLFKNYLTIQVSMLQRIHHQYNRYESSLDNTLIGIESLSFEYLTHCILDPKVLARYLEAIADDMEDMAPDCEPVFTNVYQYYSNSLASLTNTIDDLILQLPILIKLEVQVPMSPYSMDTVPIPLDAETYTGDKQEYTQIFSETEYIALTESTYVPLMQAQISLCAKIGYMYYCEYAHLLNKHKEHTCMSVIYYDQSSDTKADKCKTIITFDTL